MKENPCRDSYSLGFSREIFEPMCKVSIVPHLNASSVKYQAYL